MPCRCCSPETRMFYARKKLAELVVARPEIAKSLELVAMFSSTARRKAKLELGGTTLPGSPADFGKFIADETEKWAKVIRTANIKAE